jgi:hypothetical protein
VLGIGTEYFRVVDDDREPILYPKYLFEVCDDTIPPGWQFREFSDGECYLDLVKQACLVSMRTSFVLMAIAQLRWLLIRHCMACSKGFLSSE